jgi:hypothetical protein
VIEDAYTTIRNISLKDNRKESNIEKIQQKLPNIQKDRILPSILALMVKSKTLEKIIILIYGI